MATRMMTLLYGDKPEADVEPGNRVDLTNGGPHASPPPMRTMTVSEPHGSPQRSHLPLGGLVLGLAAAASVVAGIASTLVALVWSRSIAPGAQVALFVVGVFLLAGGVAYVVSNPTKTR